MKAIIRIPTEQYAYIEFEVTGTAEEIILQQKEITTLLKNESKLSKKEFNQALDSYLNTGHLAEDDYHKMSFEQQDIIQELKRAFKRAKAKITSDKDGIMEDIEDLEWEHEQHTTVIQNCSKCYKK